MQNREIFAKIWENIENDKILLLNGARQTGKTTLLKMIQEKLTQEKGVKENQIHYFDLEKSEDLAIWSSQTIALQSLPKKSPEKHYLFIDEFQKSRKIGSILKVIHDHHQHIKPIVTGSASWYLGIDESMAGRKIVFNIWPLSFHEYMAWIGQSKLQTIYAAKNIRDIADSKAVSLINDYFINFISYGGYPAVVLAEVSRKPDLLSELINSYILKDIQLWNWAANTLEVKKLLTILASQTGSTLSLENLSLSSGLGRTALKNRLELLQNTFILIANQPYFTNKLKELVKSPKVYLVDNGLRNSLLGNFSIKPQTSDFGSLVENFVVTESYKRQNSLESIYYWRTKTGQEVDIVKKHQDGLTPIEVKSGNYPKIPAGLKSFIERYNPEQAFVLNWDTVQDIKYHDTLVKFRPLWFAF